MKSLEIYEQYTRIILCLGTFILCCCPVLAQTSETVSNPAVHAVSAQAVSPSSASISLRQNGESSGWEFETESSVFKARNDSRLIEVAISLGYTPDTGPITNVQDRDDYIEAAYLFVRNGVHYTPLFGVQHGAMGATFHQYGTAFDQASLLSELLHIAGIPNTLSVGSITLTHNEVSGLLGESDARMICEILANGGIPISIDGASDCELLSSSIQGSSYKIAHAWVNTSFSGQSVILDSALKTYQYSNGESNFLSAITPDGTEVSSAIGGSWDQASLTYSGPNPITLDNYLDQKTVSAFNVAQQAEELSVYSLVGGKRLVGATTVELADNSKYSAWSNLGQVNFFPKELKAKITIHLAIPGALPFGHTASDGEYKTVSFFLEYVGADPLVLSPIHIASPDSIFNFSGVMNAEDAATSFELSILRPGSLNHVMMDNTGIENGGSTVTNIRNAVSGDNLLSFEYFQRDTNRSDWLVELEFDNPFAAEQGGYGDLTVRKKPSVFTLSTIVLQSGRSTGYKQEIYEKFLPRKSLLSYGLFVDDTIQLYQCERQRNVPQIVGSDFGGGSGGLTPVLSGIGQECASLINGGCADTIHGCEPDEPGGTTMTIGGMSCSIFPGGGFNPEGAGMTMLVPDVSSGGGGSSGNNFQPNDACIADLSSQFPTIISHDKMLRSKAMIAASWHSNSSRLIDMAGRINDTRGTSMFSVGLVSADIIHDYDLSLSNDALRIDVDSVFSISGYTGAAEKRGAAVSTTAGLSGLEGGLLQKFTGGPRVDSAVSKADWYAWNANYPAAGGEHHGPYAAKESFGNSLDLYTAKNGNAVYSVEQSSTLSSMVIKPARSDLGPAENSQWNFLDENSVPGGLDSPQRGGRKNFFIRYQETPNQISIGNIIGSSEKGGSGVKLPELKKPELDEEELSQEGYKGLYGDFTIDSKLGFLSLSQDSLISVGQENSALTFNASYEGVHANASPLGQGWSHNHDGKVVLSTNFDALLSGPSIQSVIPFIIATKSSYLIAADPSFDQDKAYILPQTLMINGWLYRNAYDNEAQITFPGGSATFFNLPGIGYVSPNSPDSSLTQIGERYIYEGIKPYFSDLAKTEMLRMDPADRILMPGFAKIDHVKAEQYFDYSEMGFLFKSDSDTVYTFGRIVNDSEIADMPSRLAPMLTDRASVSCWPDPLITYITTYSAHNPSKCGSEAGAFQILLIDSPDGKRVKYIYGESSPSILGFGSQSSFNIGSTLDRIELWSASETETRYLLNHLDLEYASIPGIRFRSYTNNVGLDDPTDPQWQLTNGVFIPDGNYTHGQTKRLSKVSWSDSVSGDTQQVIFNYDVDSNGALEKHSPLLLNYVNSLGDIFKFTYETLATDENSIYDQYHLLKTFQPPTLTSPLFSVDYSSLGVATSLTDAEGRKVTYGINGVINRIVDPLGSETKSIYDPDGRLKSSISAPYADTEAQ